MLAAIVAKVILVFELLAYKTMMTATASQRYLVLYRVTHSVVEELKDANEQGNDDASDEHDKHASDVGNLQGIG